MRRLLRPACASLLGTSLRTARFQLRLPRGYRSATHAAGTFESEDDKEAVSFTIVGTENESSFNTKTVLKKSQITALRIVKRLNPSA